MKIKKQKSTIALFVAAAFVFVVGTALLVNNVLLYNTNVSQYVAQGYSVDTVIAYYLPAQLIPGVLEPVGTIYGIAFLLAAAAIINQKVSECLIFSRCDNSESKKIDEAAEEEKEIEAQDKEETEAAAEEGNEAETSVEEVSREDNFPEEETGSEEKIV